MNGVKLAGGLLCVVAVLALGGCGAESGSRTPELPAIQNDRGPGAYRALVQDSFDLLNEYWSRELADRDVGYEPPDALVSYWNPSQDTGCGGQRAGWNNAQYCPPTDAISWDGNWVYGQLYRQVGDASVAFLLGHEFGHLVQQRLGTINEFPLTIEGELNADCLAGAWLGAVDREVIALSDFDFDSLDLTALLLADAGGVPWTNPSAHGTAAERRRALLLGGRGGVGACLNRLSPGFSV